MSTESTCLDTVTSSRNTIDTIDSDIIRLIHQRRRASAAVQQARLDAGEPRLSHERELSIVKLYGDDLGQPGTALAMAILVSCRGNGSAVA